MCMSLSGPVSGHHYVDVRTHCPAGLIQIHGTTRESTNLLENQKARFFRDSTSSSLHISITLTVCYKSFPLFGRVLFEGEQRAGQLRIFPHFLLVCGLKKKFHENDMLLRFGQSKPKPSQQLQHHIKQGKRAKQQILHDVAKMILYKAYHLGHGLGLIMVILHQHTQQIRIKISCQEK